MEQNKDDGLFKFLAGLVIGAGTGFLVGILTADKPGRELRREITANSADFIGTLREKIEHVKDQAADAIKDFKGFADDKLKASAKNIQEQVSSLGRQLDEITNKKPTAVSERN